MRLWVWCSSMHGCDAPSATTWTKMREMASSVLRRRRRRTKEEEAMVLRAKIMQNTWGVLNCHCKLCYFLFVYRLLHFFPLISSCNMAFFSILIWIWFFSCHYYCCAFVNFFGVCYYGYNGCKVSLPFFRLLRNFNWRIISYKFPCISLFMLTWHLTGDKKHTGPK